eukprot:CAMPEP_0204254310 /NCGR_PEP_ID=MMETSP0468-20130131/2469_1 /ASSEMBLY_ACC=CAM_ASM_000383 /TAXON_ID=2969 /ORGANISM="Oxyrrhis marina" /LENGTH=560 /DNA_ID=CAMNT_0051228037 /DNA_START=102 /DNA_END=1784 /DNA_ORIENTATION=-
MIFASASARVQADETLMAMIEQAVLAEQAADLHAELHGDDMTAFIQDDDDLHDDDEDDVDDEDFDEDLADDPEGDADDLDLDLDADDVDELGDIDLENDLGLKHKGSKSSAKTSKKGAVQAVRKGAKNRADADDSEVLEDDSGKGAPAASRKKGGKVKQGSTAEGDGAGADATGGDDPGMGDVEEASAEGADDAATGDTDSTDSTGASGDVGDDTQASEEGAGDSNASDKGADDSNNSETGGSDEAQGDDQGDDDADKDLGGDGEPASDDAAPQGGGDQASDADDGAEAAGDEDAEVEGDGEDSDSTTMPPGEVMTTTTERRTTTEAARKTTESAPDSTTWEPLPDGERLPPGVTTTPRAQHSEEDATDYSDPEAEEYHDAEEGPAGATAAVAHHVTDADAPPTIEQHTVRDHHSQPPMVASHVAHILPHRATAEAPAADDDADAPEQHADRAHQFLPPAAASPKGHTAGPSADTVAAPVVGAVLDASHEAKIAPHHVTAAAPAADEAMPEPVEATPAEVDDGLDGPVAEPNEDEQSAPGEKPLDVSMLQRIAGFMRARK